MLMLLMLMLLCGCFCVDAFDAFYAFDADAFCFG